MKYFFDFEFIEDGKTIDPISLGIVAEDGREYYAVFKEFNQIHFFANPWLVENVLPGLPITKYRPEEPWSWANAESDFREPVWRSREDIKQDILYFVDPYQFGKPSFWAYYADYDWVTLCQLFGRMIDLPKNWPMYCNDIKQLAVSVGDPKLPEQGKGEHNALADAKWNKQAYEFLQNYFQSEDAHIHRSDL